MNVLILVSPQKGRKRKKCTEQWKRNQKKKLRNTGKAYAMSTKSQTLKHKRRMKPPCGSKCRNKCSENFSEDERLNNFDSYWALGDITLQRQFISNCTKTVQPTYRYVRVGGKREGRKNNSSFHFMKGQSQVRVCKLFFKNTLDINDRPIRTVLEKQNKLADVLMEPDKRGKHGKHVSVEPEIRKGVKEHIESIPQIESHYTRATSTRTYICGSKTIADIHRDYVQKSKEQEVPYANYTFFYRIFTTEYNISFFIPKKDQCDVCTSYNNKENEEIDDHIKENYDNHQKEKELSRNEKHRDKTESDSVVAVYDLQAVMQLPKGDVSVFYYKSKLNVLNFTIYNAKTNACICYIWDETNGNRGVNEIGTCVLDYIKSLSEAGETEIIFYSDNCAGQQKNKFMLALYMYAVNKFEIVSITHKFLIKGHTQNEGDSAHSLIERQVKRILKSGPIYVPGTYLCYRDSDC